MSKPKFCFYRDHFCQVIDMYQGYADLRIIADELVGGGLTRCEHPRETFKEVQIELKDLFELTNTTEEG